MERMNKGMRKEGTSEREMKGEDGEGAGRGRRAERDERQATLGRCTTSRPSTPRRPRPGETIKYT